MTTETHNFLDGKRWVVSREEAAYSWSGKKDGSRFRCFLCGHHFKEGDTCRFVFMKGMVNFLVCPACDGEDVKERALAHVDEAKQRFWYWADTAYWQGQS